MSSTGKSLSEALIFASILTQNMFIVHSITSSIHESSKLKPGENMLCTEIVSDIQDNFCTHVLPMFCKKRASDKDLPVIRSLVLKYLFAKLLVYLQIKQVQPKSKQYFQKRLKILVPS